jgi:hypothetical protein
LCKDANLNPYWSHALDQLPHFQPYSDPCPATKILFFSTPSIHVNLLLTRTTSRCWILLQCSTRMCRSTPHLYYTINMYVPLYKVFARMTKSAVYTLYRQKNLTAVKNLDQFNDLGSEYPNF